ncbi:MAG: heavy metal translocating P-type ATPase [Candidatus Promineifilaceae bacterium]|jgi:Cd2+/Zn2+-exporting ATPase
MSATTETAIEFKVQGMDCANCAKSIETAVSRMDGVQQCSLNFTTETLRITGTAGKSAITAVVTDMGYTLIDAQIEPLTPETAVTVPQNFLAYMWDQRETRLLLAAAVLLIPSVLLNEIMHFDQRWANILAVTALFLSGWPIARSGWNSLRYSREININVLMTIASIGALIIGATVEAGMVMVLFALSEALEGYTAGRARQSIKRLMQIAPATATRLPQSGGEGYMAEVPVQELAVGDLILIRPGERIPMDGRILSGSSAVDQSPITGESRLVEKEPGDDLFAGSVNGHGALEVEVTHLAADNTISRMIRLVEEAQEKRAPAQRFVDQFAHYYTPAVVGLALMVATIPPIFFGLPFWNTPDGTFGWFYRGLALLVVACPCALVISTPVSLISAISNAAKNGILFKGGVFLEQLSRVHVMAFDKTGTLTEGKPSVIAVRTPACETSTDSGWAVCDDCQDVLALAAAVESRSEHPLAHAVIRANHHRGCCDRYPAAKNVSALTGRGITGIVDNHQVIIGSHRWFDANIAHPPEQCDLAMLDEAQGYTPLMVGMDDHYKGTITVADTVRENSSDVIEQLKALGMDKIVMLTGDSRTTAEKVSVQLGVTDVRFELLPQDKVAVIEDLQAQNGAVAMVGDGINDAPALATADVGIAVGGAGKPSQAMETADITLMNDDIGRLPFAVSLSQAAMRTIYFNVAFSIGIKIIFLLLVLAGIGTMWMAVLADMGASLLVTLNGMRLLNKKPAS